MFKKNINYILVFPNCNAIHTFFMRQKIDIVMTDKNFKILYVFPKTKPFKIISPKKNVYYTFEIPINYLEFTVNTNITQYIQIQNQEFEQDHQV